MKSRLASRPASRRGWPLLSLGLLLTGWVSLRAVTWEAPFENRALSLTQAPAVAQEPGVAPQVAVPAAVGTQSLSLPSGPVAPASSGWLRAPASQPLAAPQYQPVAPPPLAGAPLHRAGLLRADRILAHAMLLQAGYGMALQRGDPRAVGQEAGPVAPGVTYAPEASRRFASETSASRWSLDLWALWREDTTTPVTSGRPSYGRSQAGAVLAYRLAPASGHAPQLHLRATRALAGRRETEMAAGLSARPIPAVPVRLAAEARVSETDRGTELRGAAYAVSELPPVRLPAGFDGEAYVQAGYVSGEFATPFVDGQARLTREVARADGFRLVAGAGAWGGAQQGTQRLDVGPSAALGFDLGHARGRLAADYRFRVAGEAQPASGPAITLTAGF